MISKDEGNNQLIPEATISEIEIEELVMDSISENTFNMDSIDDISIPDSLYIVEDTDEEPNLVNENMDFSQIDIEDIQSTCPICFENIGFPIKFICNHIYCRDCVLTMKKAGIKKCPVCRGPFIMEEDLNPPSSSMMSESEIVEYKKQRILRLKTLFEKLEQKERRNASRRRRIQLEHQQQNTQNQSTAQSFCFLGSIGCIACYIGGVMLS
jgi:hypothetical protein